MTRSANPEAACKDYATMRAQFALLGCSLTRCHRAHDGRITYVVSRNFQSRYFTHLHDLQAHYTAQIAARQRATRAKQVAVMAKSPTYDSNLD